MTLTLVLTRHAKSSWDDITLDDHERPLNARGRDTAARIGRWVAAHARPEQALVSTARRAVETWEGITETLDRPAQAEFVPSLYHAAPETMLDVLHGASAATVLMIGHNPGIADFAARLPAAPPSHPDFARYPTCATLIVTFAATDWARVGFSQGQNPLFATPRSLRD